MATPLVYPSGASLGCPNTYTAEVQWRGGGRVFVPASDLSDFVASIEWDRRLCETSQAKMVLNRVRASAECCAAFAQVEPAVHELMIYRDTEPVWLGPISGVEQKADTITVEARDISGWLGKIVNTVPVPQGIPTNSDLVDIAGNLIQGNLLDPLSCPSSTIPLDFINMLAYLDATPCGVLWNSGIRTAWTSYVLEIINNLSDKGFEWGVNLRSMYMRPGAGATPDITRPWTWPQARLQSDDLGGDITVTRSWDAGATRAFATSQQNQYAGRTVTVGATCTPYGRLDILARESLPGDQTPAEETATLLDTARELWRGRYPLPVSFRVNDGAKLSPTAPITVPQLIPGNRIDVTFADYCRPVNQGMRLVLVSGKWDQSGESIGVSLAPLLTTPTALTA